MSIGAPRRGPGGGVLVEYHAARLAGLHCRTLFDAGSRLPQVHDRLALLTVTSGEASVWCRGETHTLTPGSTLLIEPGDVQRNSAPSRYSAVMLVLNAELARALGGPLALRFASSVVRCAALAAGAVSLVEAVRAQEEPGSQAQRIRRLFELLEPLWTPAPPRWEPPMVTRARRALLESPDAVLSLEALSRRLRCAPSYLCRVFSEHTGVGPHAYQLQRRLLTAARLMEDGHTVSSAAARSGFGDESHLRRHFRRRFAITPGRYLRALAPTARNQAERAA